MAQPQRLDPNLYRDLVRRALAEDLAGGDITTDAIIAQADRARGTFLAKSPCTLAGLDVALEAFSQLDSGVDVTWKVHDGDECAAGMTIGHLTGRARALLSGERTALNFLQHLSGIATLARQFVQASGGAITILDTRKTTPTLRALEKYAVRTGGATNHRMSLNDGVMIKDNHIRLGGGIARGVAQVRACGAKPIIEVEVETLGQVDQALEAGADILLLDNMDIDDIREAVRRSRGRAKTEISGGVTLDRIPELASTGADFVSIGALTHSAPAVDISFEIEPA
ncbi:MAG TPA: carboxylating nicotinate-nucleotide diphosphorylase [Vicinamibacterales bacterium]|nr:carboxylating nicotinate-nucleotide diphosphorylase [Vicinamibacterales bacterium]